MQLKQLFCKHNWKKQNAHLVDISITYVEDSPLEEFRTYTVKYTCDRCGMVETKEKYVERGLTDEERDLLVRESKLYAETLWI